MKFINVTDPEFKTYGRVVEGYEVDQILKTLDECSPLPEDVVYKPEEEELPTGVTERE